VIVVPVAPVMTTNEDGDPTGRIGVELQVVTTRMGPLTAIKEGVLEVGRTIEESIHQIGRVFSPAGISRTFGLLFNDQARDPTRDSTSVVGISQQVGSIGSDGDWAVLFYFFGFITVFIGLINLLPLPPFDGGHLAVLLIEKIRGGRAIDMRKLIPVSATVLAFFVTFVVATMILDVTKPFNVP
jgi:membrane-associated protease RseP (regulator of RpoE activity)